MTPTPAAVGLRVEQVAAEYLRVRYSGPGNPMQAQMIVDGDLLATKVPFAPGNSQMNGVHGLYRAERLREVLDFYAATNQPCWVDATPATPTAVTDALCDHGFRPASHVAALYASPLPAPRAGADQAYTVEVRKVTRADLDVFLDTINAGFGTPPAALPALRRNQSFWCDVSDWTLLLASADGRPAGAAVLSVLGQTAYLAAAATLPEYRNRGLQTALIAARIAAARDLDCREITGQAAAASVSQCNQQRAGLGIEHTKTIWTNHRPRTETNPP